MYNVEKETLPLEKLRALQNSRLVSLVKRLYDDVPFYKNQFDDKGLNPSDIKSIDDLYKILWIK